jgi:hypothetical protein
MNKKKQTSSLNNDHLEVVWKISTACMTPEYENLVAKKEM